MAQAPLHGPASLARDGDALYVVDLGGKALRRLRLTSGELITVHPSEPWHGPFDVAVAPDGELVLIDRWRIVRLGPDGRLTVLATRDAIQAANRGRELVTAVAGTRDAVFAASVDGIVRIDRATGAIAAFAAAEDGEVFNDIASDADGGLYVAAGGTHPGGHRIRRLDGRSGAASTLVHRGTPITGAPAGLDGRVEAPRHLALDGRGGVVFCDATRILRLELSSGELRLLSAEQPKAGWASLAVAADGALLVADYINNRIRRIDVRSGRIDDLAGDGPPMPMSPHADADGG